MRMEVTLQEARQIQGDGGGWFLQSGPGSSNGCEHHTIRYIAPETSHRQQFQVRCHSCHSVWLKRVEEPSSPPPSKVPEEPRYGQSRAELETRFTYHPPKEGQTEMYTELRDLAHDFADIIDALVPESREKALAFTKLEEAVMWSNAGIARRS